MPMTFREEGKCSSCGAKILWVKYLNGSRAPMDFDPVPDGNVFVDDDGLAAVVPKADLFSDQKQGPLYKSHFSSCPNAKAHRKQK